MLFRSEGQVPRVREKPKLTRTRAKWLFLGKWERGKYEDLQITDAILEHAKEQLDITGFKTPAGDSIYVPLWYY